MSKQNSKWVRSGFTLVELLVVVGIIGVLISVLLPAVQMIRESARRITCLNSQKQIVLALHSYESAHETLPETMNIEHGPEFLFYWQAQLLPYLEQGNLFEEIRQENRSGTHVYFHSNRTTNIPILQCVSNPDVGQLVRVVEMTAFAFTDYCGVAGSNTENGVFQLDTGEMFQKDVRLSQITGGLSNCLIFGERPPSDLDEGFGSWLGGQLPLSAAVLTNGTPENFEDRLLIACDNRADLGFQMGVRGSRCDWTHHWSFHPGGSNFARVDGSTAFIPYTIDREVLANLASKK